MTNTRYGVATTLAIAVTFSLLLLMQTLIAGGEHEAAAVTDRRIVDIVRVIRTPDPQPREERPEKPPEPLPPPNVPEFTNDHTGGGGIEINLVAPSMDTGLGGAGFGFGIQDGEYLPIVRASPAYPMRAVQLELEGHVLVEFTVTRTGSVTDVIVLESSHRIFESAAIEAAQRFRYRPRIIDGETVDVTGVTSLFTFVLEN